MGFEFRLLFRPGMRSLLLVFSALSWLAIVASPARSDDPPSAVGPLLKLYQSGRLPPERQGAVLEMICNRGNEHDLRVVFDRLIDPQGLSPELRPKVLAWLTDAALTRKVQPAGELAALEQLVTGEAAADPLLQRSAIKLAAAWQAKAVLPALQQLAANPRTRPDLQQAAIEGLTTIGDPASRQTLEQLARKQLAGQDNPLRVRMLAAAGLASIDLEAASAAAAEILADARPDDDPAVLLNAFLDRQQGSKQLGAALARTQLTPDVAKRALRHIYSVGRSDPELGDVLSVAAGLEVDAPPPSQAEVALIAADVVKYGDAARGEEIFRRKDLNCMKCHSLSRAGGQVGPDLSAIGGTSPMDYIVNSILNPDLAIKEQYVTRLFVLDDGTVRSGVVVDRDEVRVRIRDNNGELVVIPVADIEDEAEGKSPMPQGLTKFLTRSELLDLSKFVSELGKPGPYAVQQTKTIQRWRVLRDPQPELVEDVPHLEYLRQYVLDSEPTDWDSAYSRIGGVLPLRELRPDDQPRVLILQGEFQVNSPGTIQFEVQSTENVQVWIDASVYETRRSFAAELAEGRHAVTVRVEVSDRARPELRVELKQPAGDAASFEIVGGP